MENPKLMPELKDLLESVRRFHALHPEGCFIFHFLGFQPSKEEDDDEEPFYDIDIDKTALGMYGDIYMIRQMLNDLRDIAENEKDDEEFVNL